MLGGTCLPRGGLAIRGELVVSGMHAQSCGWEGSCHSGLGKLPAHRNAVCGEGPRAQARCGLHSALQSQHTWKEASPATAPHAQAPPSPRCTGRSPGLKRAGALRPGVPPSLPGLHIHGRRAGTAGSRALGCGVQTGGRARLRLRPPRRTPLKLNARDTPSLFRERVDLIVVFFNLLSCFYRGWGSFPPAAATDQDPGPGLPMRVTSWWLLSTVLRRVVSRAPRPPRSPGPAPPSHTREMRAVSPPVTSHPAVGSWTARPLSRHWTPLRRGGRDGCSDRDESASQNQVPMWPTPQGPACRGQGPGTSRQACSRDRLMLPVDTPGRGIWGAAPLQGGPAPPRSLVSH